MSFIRIGNKIFNIKNIQTITIFPATWNSFDICINDQKKKGFLHRNRYDGCGLKFENKDEAHLFVESHIRNPQNYFNNKYY